jgi:hypothetical protein
VIAAHGRCNLSNNVETDAGFSKKGFESFRETAVEYCRLIDAVENLLEEELLRKVQPLLAALYAAAWRLPVVEPVGDEDEDICPDDYEVHASHARWQPVFELLKKQLGKHDRYWTVFSPYGEEETPHQGSLADDLADIYCDLQDGLERCAIHGVTDETLWELRQDFLIHWGAHATGAIRTIHDTLRQIEE